MKSIIASLVGSGFFLCAVALSAEPTQKQERFNLDLTESIDALMQKHWMDKQVVVSERSSDGEFARRIYLDLIGRIPTPTELQNFLLDPSEEKRSKLIEDLIQDAEFGSHFADVFDGFLLGRTTPNWYAERDKHGWRSYLRESFNQNRPWNQMARDMTLARATDSTDVRAGWYLFERNNNHQAIAEAVAPHLLGIRIECAQCHDHPLASEILQEHYWGMVSFFKRGQNRNTPAGPRVVESAIGGFDKFTDLSGENHNSVLTFFESEIIAEEWPQDEQKDSDELYAPSETKEPRVPKFSRREQFAQNVLMKHPLLAKAFVNRIWALLMGRGIVHPVDRIDSTHEPFHPELFDYLSRDFEKSGFDIKRLVMAITNSQSYQLSSVPKSPQPQPEDFAYALEKPLAAEAYLRSMLIVLHNKKVSPTAELLQKFRNKFGELFAETVNTNTSQTLFLSNNELFYQMIQSSSGGIIEELKSHDSVDKQLNTIFEIVFSRNPSPEERDGIKSFLAKDHDQTRALQNVLWAMLTSAEFRFNH